MFVVETLNADGQPIDAGLSVAPELFRFKSTRIRLKRNFCFRVQRDAGAYRREDIVDGIGREQARCPTAEENRINAPPPYFW